MMFTTKKKLKEIVDSAEKLRCRLNDKIKNNRDTSEAWASAMVRILIMDFAMGILKENDYIINSDTESKIRCYISELNTNIRLSVVEYKLELSEIVVIHTINSKYVEIRYLEEHYCSYRYYTPLNKHNNVIKIDIPNDMIPIKEE